MIAECCQFPDGVTVKLGGEYELDPCIYETVEAHRNVTVRVLRCKNCGKTIVEWERQENTEDVEVE